MSDINKIQTKLSNLPDFEDLNRTLSSYYEVDSEVLQDNLTNTFNLTNFDFINLRFVNAFINAQASLYSNSFTRQLDYENQIDIDILNNALMESERYYHLFKRSAIFIDYNVDNTNYDYIRALDPTIYFVDVDTNNVYLKDGNDVLLFESVSKTKVNIYSKTIGFQQEISYYDITKSIEDNGYTYQSNLDNMPIIEVSYNRIPVALKSQLITLEENQINSISWGLFNANPKLLMQSTLETGMKPADLMPLFEQYGKTNKMVLLGQGDKLNVFDTGDITVLKDLLLVYKDIVVQKALTLGVDKNSLIASDKVESGESKKVGLSYINNIRKNYMFTFKIFDRKVIDLMEKMKYKISNYGGIVYNDIEIVRTKEDSIVYANEMYNSGYWTFEDSYAYIHQISVELASEEIKSKGLTPSNNYFLNDNDK